MEMAVKLLGLAVAWLGTGGDHSQAPRGSAAGEPPSARWIKTPNLTSNSKTLSDWGREGFPGAGALRVAPKARASGDHWRPLDISLGSSAALAMSSPMHLLN